MTKSALKLILFANLVTVSASAQTLGMDPATGARPGHVPGVGLSYPLSTTASNITPADTTSPIAPTLPSPPVRPNASPGELLMSARQSLQTGQTGVAQQALEMAETRLLDRTVPIGATDIPSASSAVAAITRARSALSVRNLEQAMREIDTAMRLVG